MPVENPDEHLPECNTFNDRMRPMPCICDYLRTCTERVLAAAARGGTYDRVTVDGNGTVDEVVVSNSPLVHVEHLHGKTWWMGVYLPGTDDRVCLTMENVQLVEEPNGLPVTGKQ